MPVYDYRCEFGHMQEAYRLVDRRRDLLMCNKCGYSMYQIITTGFINGMKGYPYFDGVLERRIDSPGQKRSLLKKLGLEQKC